MGGESLSCNDGLSCTVDSCDSTSGCVHADASCNNDDGCCPEFCDATNDNDCPSRCGDGVVSSGEDCDDGNLTDNDGCSSACLRPCHYDAPLTCSSYWTRTLPEAVAVDIALDSNENVYLVGLTRPPTPEILVVKYDRCGDFRWSKTFAVGSYDTGH